MENRGRAIALGFFDGVHIGHAALLEKAKKRAEQIDAEASVLSFDVHPDTLVFGKDIPLINSNRDREEIIRNLFGIRDLVVIHFDVATMHMPWKEFVDELIRKFDVRWFVVGHDFTFGNRGEGNAARLQEYARELGIGCDVIPAVKKEGIVVSSTYIRELIENGEMERADEFLGHPHVLVDHVRTGYQLGTKMGTPTINMMIPAGVVIPRHGVYAAQVVLEDGSRHVSVTNVGVRPTVSDANKVNVESYILDFEGDLYGTTVRIEFYKFLRDERKFSDYQELSEQILKDAEETRAYFEQ